MLASSGVRWIRDLRVGLLAAIALKILVRELEARLHVCVACVVERGQELDVGLLAVILVRKEADEITLQAPA